jgi:N-acetylglucosaminyl-diphospho-decaprenol L-rhamnosyltransferase
VENSGWSSSCVVDISIVSHGHGEMVALLTRDLLACPEVGKIIITRNIPEETELPVNDRVLVRCNRKPAGYGANQNAAFKGLRTPFIGVLNPDVRLDGNPFPALLEAMQEERIAATAPVIITPGGKLEDSARPFPTLANLLSKAVGLSDGAYFAEGERQNPDWLAGMFLLLRSSAFVEVGGFDESYHLYYEDVDLCWCLRRRGYALRQVPTVRAIHDARRASRHDWRHARWHFASMLRFLVRSSRS